MRRPLAAGQPETDSRRLKRVRVARWTQLHSLWLWVAHAGFARWLEDKQIVPRAYLARANLAGADLAGAYLAGAYRGTSPAPAGWHTLASGYLERDH